MLPGVGVDESIGVDVGVYTNKAIVGIGLVGVGTVLVPFSAGWSMVESMTGVSEFGLHPAVSSPSVKMIKRPANNKQVQLFRILR